MTQRLPTIGGDNNNWGTVLNGFLGVSLNADGTINTSAVGTAGGLLASNNLSDVTNVSTSRTNLGLNTASTAKSNLSATVAPTSGNDTTQSYSVGSLWVNTSTNLAYVCANASTGAAVWLPVLPTGTGSNTVAAGNDSRITGALQSANNLSELTSTAATARTNLGLGSSSTQNTSYFILSSTVTTLGDLVVGTGASAVTRFGAGSNGQVAMYDSTQSAGLRSVDLSNIFTFYMSGTLTVKTGASRQYVESAYTITNVRAAVGTAPTGASIIVDVLKNGTSIYNVTPANRPTIAAGSNTATANSPDTTSLSAGDYLTVNVVQIGSTIAGADLTLTLTIRKA